MSESISMNIYAFLRPKYYKSFSTKRSLARSYLTLVSSITSGCLIFYVPLNHSFLFFFNSSDLTSIIREKDALHLEGL